MTKQRGGVSMPLEPCWTWLQMDRDCPIVLVLVVFSTTYVSFFSRPAKRVEACWLPATVNRDFVEVEAPIETFADCQFAPSVSRVGQG